MDPGGTLNPCCDKGTGLLLRSAFGTPTAPSSSLSRHRVATSYGITAPASQRPAGEFGTGTASPRFGPWNTLLLLRRRTAALLRSSFLPGAMHLRTR